MLRWIVVFLIGLGVGAAVFRQRGAPDAVEVTINGENVRSGEFFQALKLAAGPQVLQRIVEQHLILQEAKRQKLDVDIEDIKRRVLEIEKSSALSMDSELRAVVEREARAKMLMRAMILKDVTEEQKREFYKGFRDELRAFDVRVLVVESESKAREVKTAIQEHRSFADLCREFGQDNLTRENAGEQGLLTVAECERLFGGELAARIPHLTLEVIQGPIAVPQGLAFVKVTRKLEKFEDLKRSIEDRIVESRREAWIYELVKRAAVASPYLARPKPAGVATLIPPGGANR